MRDFKDIMVPVAGTGYVGLSKLHCPYLPMRPIRI